MIDFFDIEDWMIIGPMAEDLADDEEKRRQIENDHDLDQDDEDSF
ncbi:MAG: hypothetical protein PF503_16885 [Desulfobacula sp.]|jgi:hypothetical protein|nr:hypothetical protein [Desulfobacula sp.]